MASDITRDELAALGLRAEALAAIPTDDQDAEIEATSGLCRAYLRARYLGARLTAAVADPAYKGAVAKVCTRRLLSTRGFNPEQGNDEELAAMHDGMLRFLRDVSNGVAHLDAGETQADTFVECLEPLSDELRGN